MILRKKTVAVGPCLFGLSICSCLGQSTTVAPRDLEAVTNWPVPLYWQPSQTRGRDHFLNAGGRTFQSDSTKAAAGQPSLGPPALFVAITPCRLVDTRVGQGFTGAFGPPTMAGNTSRIIPIPASACGVPSSEIAYSLNIFVVPTVGAIVGYVKAWPDDETEPNTAVLTDTSPGAILGSGAIIPAGADGGIQVLAQLSTDLIIDINGYFALPSSLPLSQGSASAPAITFGDTSTGLFSTGPGTVNIATGGQNRLTVTANGDLDLTGNIRKTGQLFIYNDASSNTSIGLNTLVKNTTGDSNTAGGTSALSNNTLGCCNTAVGVSAMAANTTASFNTAFGLDALAHNVAGHDNAAIGIFALQGNTSGYSNTASGASAMNLNTTGYENTAVGEGALFNNSTGSDNVAIGVSALSHNTIGGNNIAIGNGSALTTGSFNIDIGGQTSGVAGESSTIRIGVPPFQNRTFIAGIRGVATGNADAVPIVIDSNGQLGTVSSSRRFKTDIQDMGAASSKLMDLRPVIFRYTRPFVDGSSPIDYGLIAEDVAEVYPDLVVRGSDGLIETVQYQKLVPMLLNELKKQNRQYLQHQETVKQLRETVSSLQAQVSALQQSVSILKVDNPAQ